MTLPRQGKLASVSVAGPSPRSGFRPPTELLHVNRSFGIAPRLVSDRAPLRAVAQELASSGALIHRQHSGGLNSMNRRAAALYDSALACARAQHYDEARDKFELLLMEYPHLCKAWVSYAQMEKRVGKVCSEPLELRLRRCKRVLHRGMTINKGSACIAQAWGLLELQGGNHQGAVMLLERCVRLDPKMAPVLRWQRVREAKSLTDARRRRLITTAPSQ